MDVIVRWIVTGSVIAVVIYMVVNAIEFRGSDSWPLTSGTVEGEAAIRKSNHDYYGTVTYSYIAGGEHYSGEWLTPPFFNRDQLMAFISSHFPPGQSVTVRYHPTKIARSMLEVDPEIYNRNPMIKLGI